MSPSSSSSSQLTGHKNKNWPIKSSFYNGRSYSPASTWRDLSKRGAANSSHGEDAGRHHMPTCGKVDVHAHTHARAPHPATLSQAWQVATKTLGLTRRAGLRRTRATVAVVGMASTACRQLSQRIMRTRQCCWQQGLRIDMRKSACVFGLSVCFVLGNLILSTLRCFLQVCLRRWVCGRGR